MNDSALQRIRELLWRRHLSASEAAELQALLAANPEALADFEIESALNRALEHLLEAPPVSSNFTALVVQAVERETNVRNRTDNHWSLRRWLPRFAVAALVLVTGLAGWHRHEANQRAVMARDVAQLGAALMVSGPELTQNFEPIRRLDSPKADTDLLALMQ